MSPLVHCIYTSAATHAFDAPELAELLRKARENNDRCGLTGMLLYTEGTFFQVLEGAPEVVEALLGRIELDRRHHQLTRIITEPIAKRSFESWTMGFQAVSREELAGIPGLNDFFGQSRCFADLDSSRAKKLLAAFRDGRWRKGLSGAQRAVRA
jgi:hypothetical protein